MKITPKVKADFDKSLENVMKTPASFDFYIAIHDFVECIERIGHARYSVIRELYKIKHQDVSDSNSFWKKREAFRKLAGEIYAQLMTPAAV